MGNLNPVLIGVIVDVRPEGDLCTYTLDTGYQWEDAIGAFEVGEHVQVTPYTVELVHVSHIDN